MKKSLLIFLSLMPFALGAQITIEASDLPEVDDAWEITNDGSVSNLDLGMPGGGQNWDFSDLQLNDISVESFADPSILIDNVDDFPGADLLQYQPGSTRASFFDISDDAVYDMGLAVQLFGQPFLTSIPYVPPVEVRALPTDMGTAFVDTFSFDITLSDESIAADSIRIKHLEARDSEIDAWGTLTTPSGTFDVLRERLVVQTLDSVWSYVDGAEIFSNANSNETTSYNWLAKEIGVPVVSVILDDTGQPQSASWWVAEGVAPPVPVYAYTYASGSGLLQFEDLSAFEPDSWFWEFGDNTTSFEQNPLHQYSAPGEYEVCLTVENEFGSNTACQIIYVFFAPEANFSVEDLGGGEYGFTDLTTDTATLWSWDFGDGETSIEQSPTHLYLASGTYTVCLTAINPAGSDQFCMEVEVVARPVASFTFENLGDAEVAFTDLSTNVPDSWLWDFGDGSTSTEQNPTHTYTQGGNYVVCLTAGNAAGSDMVCDSSLHVIGTAVVELPLQQALKVYPNPASTEVFFVLDEAASEGNLSLRVENMLGQVVVQGKPFGQAQGKPFGGAQDKPFGGAQGGPFGGTQDKPFGEAQGGPFGKYDSVDLSSWPSGVYVYRLSDAQGRPLAVGKVIKK